MGLDSVELIVKIEKVFDIQIPDSMAQNAVTVGKLYDIVWSLLNHKEANRCVTQPLFYRLRRYIAEDLGFVGKIGPETDLVALFPIRGRRKAWKNMEDTLALKLPPLVMQNKLFMIFVSATFCLVLYGSFLVNQTLGIGAWIYPLGLFVCMLLMPVLSPVFDPIRFSFSQTTMKELTNKVLELNFSALTDPSKSLPGNEGISRKEIEVMINNVISDCLGVHLSEISVEKSFVDDFGID